MTMNKFDPPDYFKVSKEEKIKALKDMKKRHPEKAEMIDEIIISYEKGILG